MSMYIVRMCRVKFFVNVFMVIVFLWLLIYLVLRSGGQGVGRRKRYVHHTKPNNTHMLNFLHVSEEPDMEGDCEDQCGTEVKERDYGNFDPSTPIRILSWTKLWGKQEGPWYEEGAGAFADCDFDPPLQCEYTHDKSLYNVSDAVLFHSFFLKDIPKVRIPGQKWVFWEYESPRIVNILQNLQKYRYMFNVTSTYAMTSDVPLPFLRRCVPDEGEKNVRGKKSENYAKGKDRLVAWFVSHCQTPSRRENYVRELQNHIPVDIYGKCGPYKCAVTNRSTCYKEVLERRYKFYLAFENSLCRDYVTEKLWDIFDHRLKVVPVVLGAADYSAMLPEGTYINIKDFRSPSHLAVYLKYLDRHPEKYNEYIRRRKFDSCRYLTPYSKYQCGLCEHLHQYRGVHEVALNVATQWGLRRRCTTPRLFYEGVASEVVATDSKPVVWGL